MKAILILAVFMTVGLVAANEPDKYTSVSQNVNSGTSEKPARSFLTMHRL